MIYNKFLNIACSKENRLVGFDIFPNWGNSSSSNKAKDKLAALADGDDTGFFESVEIFLTSLGGGLGTVFTQTGRILELSGDVLEKGVNIFDKTLLVAEKGYDKFADWWENPGELNVASGLYAGIKKTPEVKQDANLQNALKMYNAQGHLMRKKAILNDFYKDATEQLRAIRHELARRAKAQMDARAEIEKTRSLIKLIEPKSNDSKLSDNDRIKFRTELARLNSKLRTLNALDNPLMSVKEPRYVQAQIPGTTVYIDRYSPDPEKTVTVNLKHLAEELLLHTLSLKGDLEDINGEIKKTVYWREYYLARAYYPSQFNYSGKPPKNESVEDKADRLALRGKEIINRSRFKSIYESNKAVIDGYYSGGLPAVVPAAGPAKPIEMVNVEKAKDNVIKAEKGKRDEAYLKDFN